MFARNLLRHAGLLALVSSPILAHAAPSTDPLFSVGLLGAYNKFKF